MIHEALFLRYYSSVLPNPSSNLQIAEYTYKYLKIMGQRPL